MKRFLIPIFSFILFPAFVSAHIDGPSLEAIIDGHKFDIGYSQEPVVGELVRFDLTVSKADSPDNIAFTSAWVRIEQDKSTVFAGPIADGEFGVPGFSTVFPREGNYVLFIRFQQGEESIVQGELPFAVAPAPDKGSFAIPFICGGVGLVIGGAASFFIRKKYA